MVATVGEREDSFDELFVANYALLTRVIYRVVGDAGSAEELASEAFWKLYRNPPATRQNLEGWLYRTGLRLALDTLRKRKRRARYEALAPTPGEVANPEDALHQREEAARVRRVLAALKPEQASLLVLRGEGYRLAEIAALLSVHANSTGTLLARADAAFRKDYAALLWRTLTKKCNAGWSGRSPTSIRPRAGSPTRARRWGASAGATGRVAS